MLQKAEEENQSSLTEAKSRLEEENAERKRKLLEDLKRKNEEEIEQLKIRFVSDMQQRKEELLQEHEEVMAIFCSLWNMVGWKVAQDFSLPFRMLHILSSMF